ncbi:MAG: EAL domain-containing protein [Croceibacterium sp.]
MLKRPAADQDSEARGMATADRDVVALGIAIAALILFIGTGGSIMPRLIDAWMGRGAAPDPALTNAVLLNIALLIFGWRRYRDLQGEVAQRRKAEAVAHQLAQSDPLTDCLNRRSGGPAIDALSAECTARKRELAVMLIDIDNFKQVNDLNGHRTGDLVLTELAGRIRALLPDRAVLARIGGDEFVCALPYDLDDRAYVERFAANLIEEISLPIADAERTIQTTVSLGIASDRNDDGSAVEGGSDTLMHRADIAMYHAKKRGRNRFYWFKPQMEHELRFRNELESGIRRGLAAGEFVPYYEQQVDLETGDLVGFEMLARWQSPQFGLVSPETFIPVAEDMDIIGELSESLIRQALRDAREWHPKLTLSVNISPVQLRDPWFAQKLLKLLVDGAFPPERLEIEITESCLHENIGAVRAIVMSLKNQGVRISLDDFGTGYSSLSQLRSLPFDRLKIDRSFVTELARDDGNRELVKAIVSLGRGLTLPVTAEGVETRSVLEALRGLGELKGQGYLYGHPETAAATLDRLDKLDLLSRGAAGNLAAAGPAVHRKAG